MKKYIAIICSALAIAGCAPAPDCASQPSLDMVTHTIKENGLLLRVDSIQMSLFQSFIQSYAEMVNKVDDFTEDDLANKIGELVNNPMNVVKDAKLNYTDIVTLSKNKETGNVQCRARISINLKDVAPVDAVVQYSVEATSDGSLSGTLSDLQAL